MKKLLHLLLMAAAFLSAGCSRNLDETPDDRSVSFEVSLEGQTKAEIDGDGKAAHVSRCILQVWSGEELCGTYVTAIPKGGKSCTFGKVLLNPDKVFDFLFWADYGAYENKDRYYSTTSLREVKLINKEIGNTDFTDAFCGSLKGYVPQKGQQIQRVTLHRPLSQLNIITEDLRSLAEADGFENFRPKTITYSYQGCTAYDVYQESTVGPTEKLTVKKVSLYGASALSANPPSVCTLAMTYLFAENGSSVSDVSMTVYSSNGASLSALYPNVPFKKNYRTNIHGSLMMVKGDFKVTLDPIFDGSLDE